VYDPCEGGFECNVKCVIKGVAISSINDGCIDDTYCKTGTTCVSGLCKATSAAATYCISSDTCLWNQYCSAGTCMSKLGVGEDCIGVGGFSLCKTGLTCYNRKCIELFSIDKDGDCTDTSICKTGLICKDGFCKEPKHALIVGSFGVAWGGPCNPIVSFFSAGCRCHQGLKDYLYLKETSATFHPSCPQKMKDLDKCLTDKGCSSASTKALSCLRTNCYPIYAAAADCSTDPTLTPPRCSGNAIMAAMILLVIMLFI